MFALNEVQRICIQNDYLTGKSGDSMSYAQDVASFFLPRKAWITSIRFEGERI